MVNHVRLYVDRVFCLVVLIPIRVNVENTMMLHQSNLTDRSTLRLDPVLEEAVRLYMRDHPLISKSEMFRIALRDFLEQPCYLRKTKDGLGYEIAKPERS